MEQINYTKTTKKYQHLKYEQRLNLEFYLKNKKKLNLILLSNRNIEEIKFNRT